MTNLDMRIHNLLSNPISENITDARKRRKKIDKLMKKKIQSGGYFKDNLELN